MASQAAAAEDSRILISVGDRIAAIGRAYAPETTRFGRFDHLGR